MPFRLSAFPADSASVVSSWATTDEDVVMWPAAGGPAGQPGPV
jgi:hypothetical protein